MKASNKEKIKSKKFNKVKKLTISKLKELQGGCRGTDCYGDKNGKSKGDYDRK